MEKVALLVDFVPRTRVIVEVPDNMSVQEYLQDRKNYNNLVKKARKQMLPNIEQYLNGDNLIWEEDIECPFGTFSSDK